MSIYLDSATVSQLIKYRDDIFQLAAQVYQQHGLDILANDTLNALSIHEIVTVYDPEYNTNFHRNGEDARSGQVLIENKCATVTPKANGSVGLAAWQFHAQGRLDYDRYIFAIRRKDTLAVVRLYDVSSPAACAAVQRCLADLKQKWINKGKPNHDAIAVPEKLMKAMSAIDQRQIGQCQVVKV